MSNYLRRRITVRKHLADNTWETSDNAIVLGDATDFQVSRGIGKKKDNFNFRIRNFDNNLFETFYNGDGNSTQFVVEHGPIPSAFVNTSKVKVFLLSGGVWVEQAYGAGNDYIISGSTISFTNAPSSGIKNIKLRFSVVGVGDLIRIYRWKNREGFTDDDLIEEGIVRTVGGSINDSGRVITIRGEGFMSILFNGLVFERTAETKTLAHEVIQNIIAQLNEFNTQSKIYGENSDEWATLGNDITTQKIQVTTSYKSAIELIQDISTNKFTGNGQYIFYVVFNSVGHGSGATYDFIWKAKPVNNSQTLTEGTDTITNVKPQDTADDVISAAVYNCGFDSNNAPMEFFYYSPNATAGGIWKYFTKTNTLGEMLIEQEFRSHDSVWDKQTLSDGEILRTSNFPNNYTDYTMKIKVRDSNTGEATGAFQTPSSDSDFNQAIRDECRWLGRFQVIETLESFNEKKYKVVIEMDFGSDDISHALGEKYKIEAPSFGLFNKSLRLMQIDYNFWTTDLHFEEDETTIGE